MILLRLLVVAGPWVIGPPAAGADEPIPFVEGSWTMVVVPDTQLYVYSSNPDVSGIFTRMTNWMVSNKDARAIQFLMGEGDITHNNTAAEWGRVKDSVSALDGHLPYALPTGNHDYADGGASDRSTMLNDYFRAGDNPLNDPAQGGTLAGFYEAGKLENTYHRFTAPDGRSMLIFSLEWGPRNGVMAWAGGVAARFPNDTAVLATHAYLYSDDTRYDWAAKGSAQSWNPHAYGTAADPDGTNDGQELWQKLVR